MRAKRPITRVEYSYGGLERRKVRVVQKLVNVILVQKAMRHACTSRGWWMKMVRMDQRIRK